MKFRPSEFGLMIIIIWGVTLRKKFFRGILILIPHEETGPLEKILNTLKIIKPKCKLIKKTQNSATDWTERFLAFLNLSHKTCKKHVTRKKSPISINLLLELK